MCAGNIIDHLVSQMKHTFEHERLPQRVRVGLFVAGFTVEAAESRPDSSAARSKKHNHWDDADCERLARDHFVQARASGADEADEYDIHIVGQRTRVVVAPQGQKALEKVRRPTNEEWAWPITGPNLIEDERGNL